MDIRVYIRRRMLDKEQANGSYEFLFKKSLPASRKSTKDQSTDQRPYTRRVEAKKKKKKSCARFLGGRGLPLLQMLRARGDVAVGIYKRAGEALERASGIRSSTEEL